MRDKYLGDSYDLVKRFWAESLRAIARLYALPKFVPPGIRAPYKAMTTIPVLNLEAPPLLPFGILLDPHTGIPAPTSRIRTTPSHVALPGLVGILHELHPKYLICFDQSYHRMPGHHSREKQMQSKMRFLKVRGLASFYYASHASFLFVTESGANLAAIRRRLISIGVPEKRLINCQ